MTQGTLGLEYSAFFSSGLLYNSAQKTINSWNVDYSPSRPSSPIPIPMDIDAPSYNDRRSITPTPQTKTPVQSPQPAKIQQPSRLRKRRSSLTQATSPMNAIRSPTRTAHNALHLQRQLSTVGPVSSRSRSGSVSGEDGPASRFSNTGIASSENSLGGRLRSGSFGCSAAPPPLSLRRRPIRRLLISTLQAPLAPPPTIPLPALPSTQSEQQCFRLTNLNTPTRTAHTKTPSFSSTSASSARARGLSVSSSGLDGDANRIDEEMKEN